MSGAPAGAAPLIPREVLFGDSYRAAVQVSPDGRYISFLAPSGGATNVWVGPIDDPARAKPVTQAQGRGVAWYAWTYLPDHLVYAQDTDGDENWRLYSVDVATREHRLLTPESGVQAQFIGSSPDHPEEILVALNDRIPQLHDVYRLNLRTGERELAHENDGMLGYVPDADLRLRFAIAPTPDGGMLVLNRVQGEWQPFLAIPMEDSIATAPVSLDSSGTKLYVKDSRGRNTAALVLYDLETGEAEVLYEDPRADVTGFIIHPTERTVQAAASTYERTVWHVLDERIAGDLAYLAQVDDGELHVTSRTLDDRIWIVFYEKDNGPGRYYRYDRKARQAAFIFSDRPELEGLTLARMHPVVIEARDGFELVSYLTLPPWHEPDKGLRPKDPLPLVLRVHGGPWERDYWGWDPVHQWLANRGYAVLSVNYRGSAGFGKAFLNAGNREWAGKMHDDLVDAVQWAVANGIADPDRICIIGRSFGGYAALVGLAFTPDLFACGVSIAGPSNVVTLLEAVPPFMEPLLAMFTARVGDHRTPEGREFLRRRSPLTYAGRVRSPLLIGQGANDPRVPPAESEQMVAALKARGIPVTYVLYPDEGHDFVRPSNLISFYAVQEAFLHQHLGGRFEPIGDDFAGSSITVPVGANEISGLEEALAQADE